MYLPWFDFLYSVIYESSEAFSSLEERERISSRITSVAGLPVIEQYCSSFCASLEVRFMVSRLAAHFLFMY